jgi:FtsZ-binding cell division protein ZapB
MKSLMKERTETVLIKSWMTNQLEFKAADVAKWLNMEAGAVSPVLADMTAKGYVTREGNRGSARYSVSPVWLKELTAKNGEITLSEAAFIKQPKEEKPVTYTSKEGKVFKVVGQARLLDDEFQRANEYLHKILADYQDLRAYVSLLEEENKRLTAENQKWQEFNKLIQNNRPK